MTAVPPKVAAGVKTQLPPTKASDPSAGFARVGVPTMEIESPSGSLSLPVRGIFTAVWKAVLVDAGLASGARFTSIVEIAVLLVVP